MEGHSHRHYFRKKNDGTRERDIHERGIPEDHIDHYLYDNWYIHKVARDQLL